VTDPDTVIEEAETLRDLAWRGLCGLLNLAVIMTLIVIIGTLLV